MVTIVCTWLDPKGGTHATADPELVQAYLAQFGRFPDRLHLSVRGPGGEYREHEYRRWSSDEPLAPGGP